MRARPLLAGLSLLLVAGCDAELSRPSLYNRVDVHVTADGAGVPGAQLLLYTGVRRMAYGESGADGTYLFQRVPQNGYGVIMTVIPAGYDTVSRGPDQKPANVVDGLDVSGSTTVEVNFNLKRL